MGCGSSTPAAGTAPDAPAETTPAKAAPPAASTAADAPPGGGAPAKAAGESATEPQRGSRRKSVSIVPDIAMRRRSVTQAEPQGIYSFEEKDCATVVKTIQSLQLAAINHLHIINCGLKQMPVEILSCVSLTNLNVSENALTALPDNLASLTKLQAFDASDNELASFPDGVWPSLTQLLLFKNKLSKLPDSLGESPLLEELNLYNNKLIRLPASLSNVTTLVDLNVASNKLKTIPKTDQWVNMTRLGIYWNNIVMLPNFDKLASLELLQMQDMQIGSLPKLGSELASLTELSFSKNRIEELNADDFVGLVNLEVLQLTNNNIKTIPEGILQLPKLKQLEISGNPITELPATIAGAHLSVLFCSDTHLITLPVCFLDLVKSDGLQRCDMQNNLHFDEASVKICQELCARVAASSEGGKTFFFKV